MRRPSWFTTFRLAACLVASALFTLGAATLFTFGGAAGLDAQRPAAPSAPTLTLDQVMRMPKIDAHAHIAGSALAPGAREALVRFLEAQNFRWLDICVGGMDWNRLQQKIAIAEQLHRASRGRVAWATSFNLANWGDPSWAKSAIQTIAEGFSRGAVAAKVWKDVGMVLKDPDGKYVMIDDPRMDPVLESVAKANRTLVAHLGEPRNCWLPLESMTTESDRRYFSRNPQYHAFLHPEIPSYQAQIDARDAMLARHPRLRVVGCHLGSLEYDVDELAKRLDRYPNFAVDLTARIVHLQIQPRDKVRRFILRYQDRLLYGTDIEFGDRGDAAWDASKALEGMAATYRQDAAWLATEQQVEVPRARAGYTSRGLALPASVVRKIYRDNARKWYPGL